MASPVGLPHRGAAAGGGSSPCLFPLGEGTVCTVHGWSLVELVAAAVDLRLASEPTARLAKSAFTSSLRALKERVIDLFAIMCFVGVPPPSKDSTGSVLLLPVGAKSLNAQLEKHFPSQTAEAKLSCHPQRRAPQNATRSHSAPRAASPSMPTVVWAPIV